MRNFSKVAVTAAVVFLVSACNTGAKERQPSQESAAPKTAAPPPVSKNTAPAAINDEVLQAVYLKYLELSRALTDGDRTGARLASNALEAGAGQVSGGHALAALAAKITLASGLETQRMHFAALSQEMIRLVRKAGLQQGAIYVDYCPMALNDKGAYWLSAEKGIRNPYFGEQMLTCGEVKDTLQ